MKLFSRLLTFLFIALSSHVFAGDTTVVNTHNKVVIKTDPSVGSTEYPARVAFPDSTEQYRKVYMYLEFGCAPGLKCGEWDYTNHVYLVKNGVRHEISRFITPYGFYWSSSQNWKHAWYYDLTDFSYLLHDSVDIIYQHSGYEANTDRGWTVTMNYYFVKGQAAREPVGFTQFYQGGYPFGDVNNPFSSKVTEKNFTVPNHADMVDFKVIQTGHGMDQQENCAEFCSKERTLKMDDQVISKAQVWRDDCGANSLYPQAGTWLYNRANWCPGAPVKPFDVFKTVTPGSSHKFLLEMQTYNNTTGGSAVYDLSTYAFYFKDKRKQHDAAIDDIIAPSKHYDYLRENPVCGAPIIRVKNLGKDTIKRVDFVYGKLNGKTARIWVPCKIAPFETGVVELEAIYDWSGPGNTFYAKLIKINEADDEDTSDNYMTSPITVTPTYPNRIYVVFKSNNAPGENSYSIKDSKGNVVLSRNNFAANTIYRDTVDLKNNLCYNFYFSDEGTPPSNNPLNEDGLDWWANTGDGTGSIQIRSGKNNAVLKNFNPDFGSNLKLQFYTTYQMSVDETFSTTGQINVLPNPSNGSTVVHIESVGSSPYEVMVYDLNGRLIRQLNSSEQSLSLKLEDLGAGLYTVCMVQNGTVISKKFVVN